MTAFKTFMLENYSLTELADIARHGCSGGVRGLIFYRELEIIYKEFAQELHQIINDYKNQTDEMPKSIVNDLDDYHSFISSMVWFGVEWIAYEITHGEYVEEIA